MFHRPFRLLVCALPALLFLVGDAEALSRLAFPVPGALNLFQHQGRNAWPPLLGVDGFGFIGAGACVAVRRPVIDNSNRIRLRTIQICN